MFGIEPNAPVVHQALRGVAARTSASGTRNDEDARRGARVDGEDPAPEGHRPVAPGLDPRAAPPRTAASSSARGRAVYDKALPKRMRRLAIRSVLVGEGGGRLAARGASSLASTRRARRRWRGVLEALGFERSVLVVTGEPDANVKLSARNIDKREACCRPRT